MRNTWKPLAKERAARHPEKFRATVQGIGRSIPRLIRDLNKAQYWSSDADIPAEELRPALEQMKECTMDLVLLLQLVRELPGVVKEPIQAAITRSGLVGARG